MKANAMKNRMLLVLAALVLLTGCGAPYQYTGSVIDPPKPATHYTLADNQSQPFELGAPSDDVTLLYFGYTSCPNFCPTTMGTWKQVRQELGAAADNVRFVMISVDPVRDTEPVLREYLAHFDPTFIGIRPTLEQVEALSREYGVGVDSHAAGTQDPATAHTKHGSYTYVLDRAGQLRLLFHLDADAAAMAADIKQLLREN